MEVLVGREVYAGPTFRLLMLADHHGVAGARGLEIRLPLSHETLARLIGSTRQRVNRILNDWKRTGAIEHHYGHTYSGLIALDPS